MTIDLDALNDQIAELESEIAELNQAEEARREAFKENLAPLYQQLGEMQQQAWEAYRKSRGLLVLHKGDELLITPAFQQSKEHTNRGQRPTFSWDREWMLSTFATVSEESPGGETISIHWQDGGNTTIAYELACSMRQAYLDQHGESNA